MRNARGRLGVVFIIGILVVSFLFLDAAKYDTADRIWLSLGVGASILLLPLFFSLKGIREKPLLSIVLGGWIVCTGISLYFSQTQNYGLTELIVFGFAALMAILITDSDERTRNTLLKIIIVTGVLSSIYGLWYFTTHAETRMAGLFLDSADPRHFFPNAFSNFLLMAWPLALLRVRGIKKPLALSLMLAALYFTFSRGAWLIFMIQLGALAFYWLINRKKYQLRAIITAGVYTVLLSIGLIVLFTNLRGLNFNSTSITEKITFNNSEASTSVNERREFWNGAFALTLQRPLTGYGPMSFRYAYPPLQPHFLAISDHPHNWILKMSSETGVPAVLFFITFIALVAYVVVVNRKNAPLIVLGIALAGGFLHTMLDFNMNFIPNIFAFFIIAGIIAAHRKEKMRPAAVHTALTVWCLIALTLTTLSLYEIYATKYRREDALMPRERLIGEWVRSVGKDELLDKHLAKNPLDAYGWYLKGDSERALALDPSNHFSYYRAYIQTHQPLDTQFKTKLETLLKEYDALLDANIHYTAFTDNPLEAAKIYELLGDRTKAQEVRSRAEHIRETFAKEQQFNKAFGPRTLLEFFVDLGKSTGR